MQNQTNTTAQPAHVELSTLSHEEVYTAAKKHMADFRDQSLDLSDRIAAHDTAKPFIAEWNKRLEEAKAAPTPTPTPETMNKLYTITATDSNGATEELYCSYDRSDCVYEKDAEKEQWKQQGYKAIKIASRQTEEAPSPEVYDAATTGELKPQIEKVMKTTTDKLTGDISPAVHNITKDDEGQIIVNFEDEDAAHIIAGNIPCSTYDELESNLAALGYAPTDSDGATWILEAIDNRQA